MAYRGGSGGCLLHNSIALLMMIGGYSECPNACSGHGRCASFDMCICYQKYMAADCSESKLLCMAHLNIRSS